MKKALVDPKRKAFYVSAITLLGKDPVTQEDIFDRTITEIDHSALIVDVHNESFPVSTLLKWIDCDDNVVSYRYYLNTVDNNIYPIPESVEYIPEEY